MNYNTLSRRMVDRHIQSRLKGLVSTEYHVKTQGIEPVVLAAYINRRSPNTKVMLNLDYFNKTIITLHTEAK